MYHLYIDIMCIPQEQLAELDGISRGVAIMAQGASNQGRISRDLIDVYGALHRPPLLPIIHHGIFT